MYDHERSLVNEMKNRPFALVGVNSDKNLEKIRAIVKKKNLIWRSFQNSPKGSKVSISQTWAVKGWPTIVVIDENMRIRYRGHNGNMAITKVKELVKQLEAKNDSKGL